VPKHFEVKEQMPFSHMRRRLSADFDAYLARDTVIHPGSSLYFGMLKLPQGKAGEYPVGSSVAIDYELLADGMQPTTGRIAFTVPKGELHK
jgi:hypothetical protein